MIAISNPGVGYAVKIVDVALETKNWTVPYTTNFQTSLITDTAVKAQFTEDKVLVSSVDRIITIEGTGVITAATDTQIISNKAVYWRVDTGDPDYASGDAAQSLKLYICYRLLSV